MALTSMGRDGQGWYHATKVATGDGVFIGIGPAIVADPLGLRFELPVRVDVVGKNTSTPTFEVRDATGTVTPVVLNPNGTTANVLGRPLVLFAGWTLRCTTTTATWMFRATPYPQGAPVVT